jgi:hypothetical protein
MQAHTARIGGVFTLSNKNTEHPRPQVTPFQLFNLNASQRDGVSGVQKFGQCFETFANPETLLLERNDVTLSNAGIRNVMPLLVIRL